MKKLFAWILCLMLMTGALAETVSGARLTASEFSVEMGDEILYPDLNVVLDIAENQGVLLADFCVNLNGEALLPVQLHEFADGTAAVKLKDSGAFRFSPELLQRESGLTEDQFALVQLLRNGGPAPLAFEFVDMLDARGEDDFVLIPEDLPQWIQHAAGMEAALLATFMEELPEVNEIPVKRDSLGYTFTIGEDDPYYITVRRSGDQVLAKMQTLGYNFQWIFSPDGGVQLTHFFGVTWYDGDFLQNDLVFKYVPDEDGGAFLSLTNNYSSEWALMPEKSGKHWLNISGKMSAEGVIDGKIAATRQYGDGTKVTAKCRVVSENVEMDASIGGENEQAVQKTGSAYKMAQLKMEKDLKKLRRDSAVAAMLDSADLVTLR